MKKFLKVLTVLVLALSLVACGGTKEASEETSKEDDKITVAAIYVDTYEEFAIKLKNGIEKTCAEKGYELLETDYNSEVSKGVDAMENYINMGVDAMVLWIFNEEMFTDQLQRAMDAGIVVIAVDSEIKTVEIDGFVTNDHYDVGFQQAEKLAEGIGYEGEVVVITSPPGGQCMIDRQNGALDCFAQYPGIKVIEAYDEGGNGREGYSTTCENALLANPNVKAIWCVCADNGLGAVAAINAHGDKFKDVLCCAGDCSDECADAIKAGTMYCGYSLMPTKLASTAVDYVEKALAGEEVGNIFLEGGMYTAENIADFTD